MDTQTKKPTWRELLAREKPLVLPGAHDALSARLIEQAGFAAYVIGGFPVVGARYGVPDIGLCGLGEISAGIRDIMNATALPVLIDADDGYGDVKNVTRTIRTYERMGASAIFIEDQVAPKRCGHVAGKEVIPLAEMVGKVRAADRVRRELDPDFLLIARCDARGVAGGSVDDLIKRANAYLDAGADMIFPEALTSEAEVERCAREIKGPLHYNRTGVSPRLTLEQLNELGIAIVSNATGALRSSMIAMWDYMNTFAREDVAFVKEFTERHRQHPAGDLHAFVGFAEIKKFEQEFLPADDVAKKYAGAVGFQP
jgi:2-methylisocitrate lyase-like PEP mutase family enzyme